MLQRGEWSCTNLGSAKLPQKAQRITYKVTEGRWKETKHKHKNACRASFNRKKHIYVTHILSWVELYLMDNRKSNVTVPTQKCCENSVCLHATSMEWAFKGNTDRSVLCLGPLYGSKIPMLPFPTSKPSHKLFNLFGLHHWKEATEKLWT